MCHELTHAYDDYCEYKSTGQSYVKNVEKELIDRSVLSNFICLSWCNRLTKYSLILISINFI